MLLKETFGLEHIRELQKKSGRDTIRSASCIIGKGFTDKKEFSLYMSGVTAVSSHIFQERYSGEKAAFQACKALCLAAYILVDKEEMIEIEHPEDYVAVRIPLKEYSKLSYIRKLKLESYGYLVEGVRALEEMESYSAKSIEGKYILANH